MTVSVVLERRQGIAHQVNANLITRQRVYIFPTIQGAVYGLMLVVMLLGAINYNNSMAYMLCFLLAGLGFVCMLYTYRNLAGMIITTAIPEAVFVGQTAQFPLRFDNQMGQERLALRIRQKANKKNKTEPQIQTANIQSGKTVIIHYPSVTTTRGLIKTGRLIIETEFPLGIFRAWSYVEHDEACLVYPRPAGDKRLPKQEITQEDAELGQTTGTDDFAGFRKYRPGDAIKSIAWKAYAREQGLLVKQFSGKGSKVLMFDWNQVAGINNVEARLSQLCLWIVIAEETGHEYGLRIPNVEIQPAIGEKHRHRCLEQLARFGISDEPR
ncbi:MAG: DUF58 domain-containing protein [Pseudomonadota bacterium]